MMGLHCVIFGREEAGIVVEKERRGSRDGSSREAMADRWPANARVPLAPRGGHGRGQRRAWIGWAAREGGPLPGTPGRGGIRMICRHGTLQSPKTRPRPRPI